MDVESSIESHVLSESDVSSLKSAMVSIGPVKLLDFRIPAAFESKLSKSELEHYLTIANDAYDALEWQDCAETLSMLKEKGADFVPYLVGRLGLALAADHVSQEQFDVIHAHAREAFVKHPGDSAPYLAMALLKFSTNQRSHALQWLELAEQCPSKNVNAIDFIQKKLNLWIRSGTKLRNAPLRPPQLCMPFSSS